MYFLFVFLVAHMVYIYVVSAGFPQVFGLISTVTYAEKGRECRNRVGKHKISIYRSNIVEPNRVKKTIDCTRDKCQNIDLCVGAAGS